MRVIDVGFHFGITIKALLRICVNCLSIVILLNSFWGGWKVRAVISNYCKNVV